LARGGAPTVIDETPLIAAILRDNIYGVDINPASRADRCGTDWRDGGRRLV
jgi:hypothetical protein